MQYYAVFLSLSLSPLLLSCSIPTDVLRFDNTYSYIHAKKISYTVEVLLPDKKSEHHIQQLEDQTKDLKINNA